MLFARQGRPPAVYENPNRWDNYLPATEPCPSGRGPFPWAFFHPPNRLIQENYQTKPMER